MTGCPSFAMSWSSGCRGSIRSRRGRRSRSCVCRTSRSSTPRRTTTPIRTACSRPTGCTRTPALRHATASRPTTWSRRDSASASTSGSSRASGAARWPSCPLTRRSSSCSASPCRRSRGVSGGKKIHLLRDRDRLRRRKNALMKNTSQGDTAMCFLIYLSSATNSIRSPSNCARMEPWCPSAIERAMESPMPKPLPDERDASAR